MNYEFECEFQNPETYTGEAPTSTDFWQFQKTICQGTSTSLELIENASTGASFYISKVVGYGEILILVFLMLFLIFGILKFLVNFVIPKFISFKR